MVRINTPRYISSLIYFLVLLTLILSVVAPVYTRHVFFFSSGLALVLWLLERKNPSRSIWFILVSIAIFSVYRIGYTFIDAQTWRPNLDAWQVYISTGNRLLIGAALIGFLSTQRIAKTQKLLITALFIALSLCFLDSLYSAFILHLPRAELAHQRQTMTSYEVIIIYLVYLGLNIQSKTLNLHKILINAVACLMTTIIVLLSETRAAYIALIIGISLIFLFAKIPNKKKIFFALIALMSLITIVIYPYTIKKRVSIISSQISDYQSGKNRSSSIGARIEMWRAAIMVAQQNPILGAGFMGRKEIIHQKIEQGKLNPVVDVYAKIHLHNEYLDELSMRGLLGLSLLLLMYASLIHHALFSKGCKNIALLALIFSFAFFGLTDVLFFSREVSILFITLLALLLAQEQN